MGTFVNLKMIYEFISELPDKDAKAEKEALAHQNELTKPPGSLGQLEKIAIFFWLARRKKLSWKKPKPWSSPVIMASATKNKPFSAASYS